MLKVKYTNTVFLLTPVIYRRHHNRAGQYNII